MARRLNLRTLESLFRALFSAVDMPMMNHEEYNNILDNLVSDDGEDGDDNGSVQIAFVDSIGVDKANNKLVLTSDSIEEY